MLACPGAGSQGRGADKSWLLGAEVQTELGDEALACPVGFVDTKPRTSSCHSRTGLALVGARIANSGFPSLFSLPTQAGPAHIGVRVQASSGGPHRGYQAMPVPTDSALIPNSALC